jgi:PAS domain S-box-containing protein
MYPLDDLKPDSLFYPAAAEAEPSRQEEFHFENLLPDDRQVLAEMRSALPGATSVEHVAEIVRHCLAKIWSCEVFFFGIRVPGRACFRMISATGCAGEECSNSEATFHITQIPSYERLLDGLTVLHNMGSAADVEFNLPRRSKTGLELKSFLFAPLRSSHDVIGIFSVQSAQPCKFSDGDIELMQKLVEAASPAVLRCQAEKRSAVLAALGQRLSMASTSEEAAQIIVDAADELVGWDACSLRVYDVETDSLFSVLSIDEVGGCRTSVTPARNINTPIGDDKRQFLESAHLILREEAADYQLDLEAFGDKGRRSMSLMFVPIRTNTGPIGYLTIQSYTPFAYEPPDLEMLQVLAHHCCGALDRTRAEAELRESEARFRTVVEVLGEGLLMTDSAGRIRYANSRLCELTGYKAEELTGQDASILFDSDAVPGGVSDIAPYTARLRKQNGRFWWAEIHERPFHMRFAREPGLLRVIRDITEKREHEKQRQFFSDLVLELSSADTLGKLGQVVRVATERLWNWDSFFLLVRTRGGEPFRTVVEYDIIQGEKTPIPLSHHAANPYASLPDLMHGKPVLTNRAPGETTPKLPRFGSMNLSQSMIHAPVRVQDEVVAIVSVQSYTGNRFTYSDARLLLQIADAMGPSVERCRDREQLRISEEKYRLLVENVNDAILISQDNTLLYYNRRFADMLGMDYDELEHCDYESLYTAEAARIMEERSRLRRLGQPVSDRYEVSMRHKSGSPVDVEANVSIIEFGGKPATFAVMRDISQRKRHEEQLARLATAVEQTSEGVAIMALDWQIQYVNPAFEQITGYSADEAIGRYPRELLDSGRHDDRFFAQIEVNLRAGRPWNGRIVNRRKDGTLYEEDAAFTPIRDSIGRVISFVSVKRDVTEKLTIETQLRHSQKMEAVGQLAGGIAHDFNNLLVAIIGYGELLLNNLPEDMPTRTDVREILTAAERAASLTRKLLTFSRKHVVQPALVDLNEVIRSLENMLQLLLGERTELRINLQPELHGMLADMGQTEQVIVNLAINSRDAMPEGGSLEVETCNISLEEEYDTAQLGLNPGNYVLLTVRDTGTGMTPETQNHIFEPFFTTKGLGKGTGLGLATVYGIVKQCGGGISVESELDRGSTFRLYFPAIASEEAIERFLRPRRILLIDDEEVIRTLGERVLSAHGHEVAAVSSAEEAEQLCCSESPFDLLVTDVVLQDASGVETADQLRRSGAVEKVLFMSGYNSEALAKEHGFTPDLEFIQKPFRPEAFAERVRELLAPTW